MATKGMNYQDLNKELQEILGQLDDNSGDIDKAIAQYERGMEIVSQLEAYLKQAENKVKKVKQNWDSSEEAL